MLNKIKTLILFPVYAENDIIYIIEKRSELVSFFTNLRCSAEYGVKKAQ
jgi:hypothetical protein